MAAITAQQVKALRDATGAGMMDAKRALTDNDGDFDAATRWLRERGLGKAAERSGRDAADGAIAVVVDGRVGALVELRAETDFGAKSPQFVNLVDEMASAVAKDGEGALDAFGEAIDDLKVTLKENVALGKVVRYEAPTGHILERYLHVQNDRGVNGVLVELDGGSTELAHDIAVHIAFGRPGYVTRDEVPSQEIDAERHALEAESRNQGKPEQALAKIVDGRLTGWYKRVPGGVLLDQPYAKDDKQTVAQVLGGAHVVRFAQASTGG